MTLLFATSLLLTQLGASTLPAAPPTIELASLTECDDSLDFAIFNVPRYPHAKAPMKLLIVSDQAVPDARVLALGPDGQQVELLSTLRGGPPWGLITEIDKPTRGDWRFALTSGGNVLKACQPVKVRRGPWGRGEMTPGEEPVWKSRIKWERDTENLYSLWIEHLFDTPLGTDISWRPLSKVLRDKGRNLLFDYMGLNEDRSGKEGIRAKPDCADFPYYLRGYFAWKLGLPFAFRACRRGDATRPPRCSEEFKTNELAAENDTKVRSFDRFMRTMQGTVHSSSLRSLPKDERSDFYPVALTRHGLRPGTIYTDPYGHTMMVGRWHPQNGDEAGVLMAIDAQPDGTIGLRRFWRGSFMFPEDDAVAGAGWKRFRPVRKEREGYVALANVAIQKSIDYGDFSTEQWDNGKEAFYERMDSLISPQPMSPESALTATVDALDQQVRRRIESVDNGEQWKRERPGKTMKMPAGPAIFITSGPWEDYSTPSRDMRLLIAIDTVLNFNQRVITYPKRSVLSEGTTPTAAKESLDTLLSKLLSERRYSYTKSDGSTQPLTLAEIIDRRVELEMAYNPNDCIEVRWGAVEGSPEYASCQRRAPKRHYKKMTKYRPWFQKRERPATALRTF